MADFTFGFRILGDCRGERRLIDFHQALVGYAACDPKAEVDGESYLSAFTFGEEFREHLSLRGTTKGYAGPCFAPWLWFDIDREGDLEAATRDAKRLCAATVERYGIDGDILLIFFSGSKGYHVGLPSSLWDGRPSAVAAVARRFAEQLASIVGVTIDTSVYDRTRAFRAPNSRHPKTGLHKRHLEYDELLHLKTEAILKRAAQPEAFDLPDIPPPCQTAIDDWTQATEGARQHAAAMQERRVAGSATLNRLTLEFIREGASEGERANRLFSAAANLGEFDCPPKLAQALLTEAARDCGLPPTEIRRQIECGLYHVNAAEAAKSEE